MINFLIIKPTRCTNYSNLFLELNSTCFGQFNSKNKFVKLVHLVSFSTREAVPVFAMKVQEQLRCSISTVRFTTGVH